MQFEDQERIVIDFLAHLIDGCSNVLARHSPVRTATTHFKVIPRPGKQIEMNRLSYLQQCWVQLTIQQA